VCRLSVPYLSKYADSYEKAVLANTIVGQNCDHDKCHRGAASPHFDRLSLLLLPLLLPLLLLLLLPLLLLPPQALCPVPLLEVRGQLREGRVGQYQCGR
jgi:hypothetical protein